MAQFKEEIYDRDIGKRASYLMRQEGPYFQRVWVLLGYSKGDSFIKKEFGVITSEYPSKCDVK